LYWHFLIVNEPKLATNRRMALPYSTLRRMSDERRREIVRDAEAFLDELGRQGEAEW
jgi:deoxyribodipyrimidine photolyase-related protein